ncbi:putative bifunctional diguanylate cyclase/phosphodiesterase [Paenibacillus sedimenti]|uniref:Diguanylate cyclase n=1 Tax=Paenibacillus sedimenti TaxID=2770274 RepID=A0A926KQ60_9BACL|nr:EAL domain-containing protein [Paenibacillus sedimenti]MBD0382009.1 diguanylate cyclase [Paenibacillus sedimenti]
MKSIKSSKWAQHMKAYVWAYIGLFSVCLLTVNLLAAASFSIQPRVWGSLIVQIIICLLIADRVRFLLKSKQQYAVQMKEMTYMAYHDSLTGLPNRRLFEDRLERALLQAKRREQLVAVMLLDLDRFKGVNDTLGHACGDQLIRLAGQRLLSCLRGADTVFRQGGDEFTILLEYMAKPEDVRVVAARIQEELEEPFILDGTLVSVTASMGIALYPMDGDTPEQLMQHADEAMYAAKERGQNHFKFYASDIDAMVTGKAYLEKELRLALLHEHFELRYQPQYELASGRLKGVEAVLCWSKGDREPKYGLDWRKIADETGLAIPIGYWMLRTACMQVKSWQTAGYPPLRLTVGITSVQFEDPLLVEEFEAILKDTGMAAGRVEIDLTESISSSSVKEAGEKLRQLKALGVRIAMDDLCIGLFTRSGLEGMPMDSVKLDSTLVRDLPDDDENQALAAAIIRMAHRLGLNLIAKGVQTNAQLEHLQHLQCTEVQGELFSAPLHPTDFLSLMEENVTQSTT